MRLIVGLVIALMTVFMESKAFASGVHSSNDAISLAENAMKKIVVDDVEGALELLRPYSSVEWGEFNALAKSVADTYRTRPGGFGDSLGYTLLSTESVGDTLLRISFLQKFKRRPLQWDFYFYKPEQDWLIWTFQFRGAALVMFDLPMHEQIQKPAPQRAR